MPRQKLTHQNTKEHHPLHLKPHIKPAITKRSEINHSLKQKTLVNINSDYDPYGKIDEEIGKDD